MCRGWPRRAGKTGGRVVIHLIRIVIDLQRGAIERCADKSTPAFRIGPDPRIHLCGCCRTGLTTEGTGCRRSIGTEREGAVQQILYRLVRAKHQYDIGRLHACLKSNTSAGKRNKPRRTETTVGRFGQQNTHAVPNADNKSTFDHIRNNRNRLCFAKDLARYFPQRHRNELFDHRCGVIDNQVFTGLSHPWSHLQRRTYRRRKASTGRNGNGLHSFFNRPIERRGDDLRIGTGGGHKENTGHHTRYQSQAACILPQRRRGHGQKLLVVFLFLEVATHATCNGRLAD